MKNKIKYYKKKYLILKKILHILIILNNKDLLMKMHY